MEEFLNEHGCRFVLDNSKDSLKKHLETNPSADGIKSMEVQSIHIVCDAIVQFLEQNSDLNDRNGIIKLCESVVRLMPDIKMV